MRDNEEVAVSAIMEAVRMSEIIKRLEDRLHATEQRLDEYKTDCDRLREALASARADRDAYRDELEQLKDRLELERTYERAEAYDRLKAGGVREIPNPLKSQYEEELHYWGYPVSGEESK